MNLLIVTNMYPDSWRQSGIFIEAHNRVMKREFNVETKVITHGDSRRGLKYSIRKYPRFALRALTATIEGGYQLVHGHFIVPGGLFALFCAKLRRKPLIVTAHGGDIDILPRNPILRILTAFVLRNANKIVTVSNYLAQKISEDFRIPDGHIYVNNMGVDYSSFYPCPDVGRQPERSGVPVETFTVLFVGNIIRGKGIYELITAFAYLHAYKTIQMELFIIGYGEDQAALMRECEHLEIKDSVSFLGVMRRDEVGSWMRTADILVQPSYHESFGLTVAEALACGLPVIATAVGGLTELIEHEKNGLLISPRSITALQAALERVIDDRSLYGTLKQNCISKTFTQDINASVENMVKLYGSLISK